MAGAGAACAARRAQGVTSAGYAGADRSRRGSGALPAGMVQKIRSQPKGIAPRAQRSAKAGTSQPVARTRRTVQPDRATPRRCGGECSGIADNAALAITGIAAAADWGSVGEIRLRGGLLTCESV